jgi:hypothetical protein
MSKTNELLDVTEYAKSIGFRRYGIRVDPVLMTVLGSVYGYEAGDLAVLRQILIPLRVFLRIYRTALSFSFDIGPPNSDHLGLSNPIPIAVTYESGDGGDYFAIRILDAKLTKQEAWEAET